MRRRAPPKGSNSSRNHNTYNILSIISQRNNCKQVTNKIAHPENQRLELFKYIIILLIQLLSIYIYYSFGN